MKRRTKKQIAEATKQARLGLWALVSEVRLHPDSWDAACDLLDTLQTFNRELILLTQSEQSRGDKVGMFQVLAMASAAWPANFPAHIEESAALQKHLKKYLRLGSQCGINNTGGWSYRTTQTKIARELIDTMLKQKKAGRKPFDSLPDFSRATSEKWWKVAEPYFEQRFGGCFNGDFSQHPAFANRLKNPRWKTLRDQSTVPAKVRDEIKKDMKQAFKSISGPTLTRIH